MAFCGNCGNELREGAKFCPKCGTPVNTHQEQQVKRGRHISIPLISALTVLFLIVGSYFVTDKVFPVTHSKLFGWVPFGNSPSNTVKKAFSCIKVYDFDGYLNYIYYGKNPSEEEIKQKKALILTFGKEKMEKSLDKKGGIKDYKITSEIIDGDSAKVEFILYFGNGQTENRSGKLRKNIDGVWLLDND